MRQQPTIPDGYDGREQAWIKHQLLASYLERLLMIVGMGGRRSGEIEICYVDCFAGPWGDGTDDLAGTSIAISLKTMESCRKVLRGFRVQATMRALYIERDPQAFGKLKAYLERACPSGVQADCLQGDFVDLRDAILSWCGRRAFTFFFVDPKGWKSVGVECLQPLLARPGSEVLVNFMYDFINRTAAMGQWQEDIAKFLGCDVETVRSLDGLPPGEREEKLVHAYREGMKQRVTGPGGNHRARTAHVRVMDPTKDRPKYHLVYLTTHPKGIVEFMEISEGLQIVQRRVRATKRNARREAESGMEDLFGEASFEQPGDALDPRVVDGFWLSFLQEKVIRVGEDQMADFMESTGWVPGDYQASLGRLIADGQVCNLDALKPRRTRHLHYEKGGERLMLLPARPPA